MTDVVLTERETEEGLLVSACDADVLGETFENGQVSLTVETDFYDGEAAETGVPDERVLESLAACTTANLVGEYTVELRAESDTHRVDAASETIEVRPEDTPHPTTGPSPVDEGDGRTTVSTTRTPERPTRGSTTNESGPGLGGGVTIMGLAVLVALLGRRE